MFGKMKNTIYILSLVVLSLTSCDKISPLGVLMAGTAVEDRVKMSDLYYKNHLNDYVVLTALGDYSFLVGADSHLTTDSGRMDEMLEIGLRDNDLFYAHLGDMADTKAEYYALLDSLLQEGKRHWVDKYYVKLDEFRYKDKDNQNEDPITYTYDEIVYPFFPVVGNHDITHNGWALWSNIFRSSFYEIDVVVLTTEGDILFDHLIFLDSASGTLGKTQIDLIKQGALDGKYDIYRNTFVFSHTNIFRPQFFEFASTFTREETFFLLDQFEKWNVTCVFCGHVHKWDERDYNGVHYLTLESMNENENPDPGDYLVRIYVGEDGNVAWSPVTMNSTPREKK